MSGGGKYYKEYGMSLQSLTKREILYLFSTDADLLVSRTLGRL